MCDEKSGSPLALGGNYVHMSQTGLKQTLLMKNHQKYHLIIQQENDHEGARVASLEIFFIGF